MALDLLFAVCEVVPEQTVNNNNTKNARSRAAPIYNIASVHILSVYMQCLDTGRSLISFMIIYCNVF